MGDTLLPELGLIVSLYISTRMLELVLGPKHGAVLTSAVLTIVFAGIGMFTICRVLLTR